MGRKNKPKKQKNKKLPKDHLIDMDRKKKYNKSKNSLLHLLGQPTVMVKKEMMPKKIKKNHLLLKNLFIDTGKRNQLKK